MVGKRQSRKAKTGEAKSSDQDFLTGKLLIAMPNMNDPRFEKSVILLVSHDRDHAMEIGRAHV